MENKLKLNFYGMFRSSLDSCRSKSISDVEQPFFFPENRHHHHQLIQLFSPKPPETKKVSTKISNRSSLLPPPPEQTMFNDCKPRSKHRRHRSKSRKTRQEKKEKFDEFFSSVAANYYGWYSSEDENENAIKFDHKTSSFSSSKSMSSFDSYENDEMICARKVEDSFAVMKSSSDPSSDFRTSMVEMIVEKRIFGSKDLENLLQCFLSLNSITHHRVIIEVFTEIWETLFSDWN